MSLSTGGQVTEERIAEASQSQTTAGAEAVSAPYLDSIRPAQREGTAAEASIDVDPPSVSPLFTFLTDEGRLDTPRNPFSLHSPSSFPLAPQSAPAAAFRSTNDAVHTEATGDLPSGISVVFPSGQISSTSQVEDVAPWPVILFFLKLYLQYMHSLFPVVHKPSFFEALALRSDQTDRAKRALILALGRPCTWSSLLTSTVAYTIGQAPLTRMQPTYSRDTLERLQRRCHRASLVILGTNYSSPSLEHVATLMA